MEEERGKQGISVAPKMFISLKKNMYELNKEKC